MWGYLYSLAFAFRHTGYDDTKLQISHERSVDDGTREEAGVQDYRITVNQRRNLGLIDWHIEANSVFNDKG